MKRIILAPFAILVTMFVCSCTASKPENDPSTPVQSPLYSAAKEGDSVWVILNYVKADKKEQFEKFVHEAFWPNAQKLSESDKKMFQQTRVLGPTKQEADGSYIYIFLMDPLISGGDYSIDNALKKMHGDKWQEYGTMFGETMVREQSQYMMVQNKYYSY